MALDFMESMGLRMEGIDYELQAKLVAIEPDIEHLVALGKKEIPDVSRFIALVNSELPRINRVVPVIAAAVAAYQQHKQQENQ